MSGTQRARLSDHYPGFEKQAAQIKTQATTVIAVDAATATISYPVFAAPGRVEIQRVSVIAQAAVTGADTDTKHLNLDNKGTDGSGTTELGNYDLVNGSDLAAMDEYELYATALIVENGTVLALEVEKIGNGQNVPAFMIVTEYIDIIEASP